MLEENPIQKRKPIDTWYFVECVIPAHDSRCAHCGRCENALDKPLQRGHVKLHAEGGSVDPENIVPACFDCNKEHTKKDMPVPYRPNDWREKLAGLLLQRLQPRFYVLPNHATVISHHGNVMLTTQPTENTALIDWKNSNFGVRAAYIHDSRRMTATDAQRVIQKLIHEGELLPNPTFTPSEGRQKQMREIVLRLDDSNGAALAEKIFLGVGMFYLQRKTHLWIRDDKVERDSFGQFVDGFDGHREDRRAAHVAARKRQRWQAYRQIRECGDWLGMTEAERVLRDKAKAECAYFAGDDKIREISDDEFALASAMPRNEFFSKKERCLEFLDLCDQMVAVGGGRHSTGFLRERAERNTTASELHDLHEGIQRLYAALLESLWPARDDDF